MLSRALAGVVLIVACGAAPRVAAESPAAKLPADVQRSVQKAIPYLWSEGERWIDHRGCVSCHQVPAMLWSLSAAQQHGFDIDDDQLQQWKRWSVQPTSFVRPDQREEMDLQKTLSGNIDTMYALMFAIPPSQGDSAEWRKQFADALIANQQADGSWRPCGQLPNQKRPKPETAQVTSMWTLLALMQAGVEPSDADNAWQATVNESPKSTEWLVARLLLAEYGHRDDAPQWHARLLAAQNDDGGFGWLIGQPSDALATGMALYAMSPSSDPAHRSASEKAIAFLVSTQTDDGSWQVPGTKTKTAEETTDTSNYWGTAWAVIGMLQAAAATPGGNTDTTDAKAKSPSWKKHIVAEGEQAMTAVGGDFTGDGLPDVITDSGNKTRLYIAPDWNEVILDDHPDDRSYIHSECFDVDGDGDLDYIGARYNPGLIVWLQQPRDGATQRWTKRIIDTQVHGIHGLMQGDVDGDGQPELLATSAQPKPPYPESLVWYQVPADPTSDEAWPRHVFADRDAPGLTHYIGVGDVDGDGRLDAAVGAKGGPQATSPGEYFAWWQAPQSPQEPWTKHMISDEEPGATNIHPADVDADGEMDFIASRGHGYGVYWFQNPDWKRHTIDARIQEPHSLVTADIDNDGDIDAATCAFGSKQAAWYENDGQGQFTKHVVGENQEAYDIRAIDMDNDGDLDLLIGGRGSKNVVWYEQP